MQATTPAKVWDREAIHQLLETRPAALARAVLTIYARQTAGEKLDGQTVEQNGRGFSGVDSPFLSDIAVKLPRYDMRMTAAQRGRVLPLMKRYWRQLLEEIEAKGGQVSYKAGAKSLNRDRPEPAPATQAPSPSRAPTRGELARQF